MTVARADVAVNMASGVAELTISNSATWNLSDAFELAPGDWNAQLQMWSDNQGTPASGDTVEWRLLPTLGSVDGSAGDDYVNADNGALIGFHDTYNNDEGVTGVVMSVSEINSTPTYYKLAVKAATGATRNVKVRAMVKVLQGAI